MLKYKKTYINKQPLIFLCFFLLVRFTIASPDLFIFPIFPLPSLSIKCIDILPSFFVSLQLTTFAFISICYISLIISIFEELEYAKHLWICFLLLPIATAVDTQCPISTVRAATTFLPMCATHTRLVLLLSELQVPCYHSTVLPNDNICLLLYYGIMCDQNIKILQSTYLLNP